MGTKKKTAKQKEFDILLKYGDNKYELTRRIRTDDLELVRKYKDKLGWHNIIERKTLSNEFIDEFWENISGVIPKINVHPSMHTEFLDKNRDYINWGTFVYESSGSRFSIEFLKNFKDELKPYYTAIVKLKNLPSETREYILNGKENKESLILSLSSNADINIKTIEQYKEKLDWNTVSLKANVLNEPRNFETYKDYINVYAFTSILNVHFPNDSFMKKRLKLILNEEFLLKYKNSINWKDVINYNTYRIARHINGLELPLDFFKDHINELPETAVNAFSEWKRYFVKYKQYNGTRPSNRCNYNYDYDYMLRENHIHWHIL